VPCDKLRMEKALHYASHFVTIQCFSSVVRLRALRRDELFLSVVLAQAGTQSTDVGEPIRLGFLTASCNRYPSAVDALKDGCAL